MDHSGHSGHGDLGPRATSLAELQHPPHGSYEGHVVPAVMFLAWSSYWLWSVLDLHLRARPAQQAHAYVQLQQQGHQAKCAVGHPAPGAHLSGARGQPFASRAWYPFPYGPVPQLEPIFKLLLPLLGVAIELYIGWGGWRPMFDASGHFAEFHIGNWQHALMYAGVSVSGLVDLIGHHTPLPPGTEKGFLAVSFLVETLLMGMHAKPNPLDQLVHSLLTWVMVACVAACVAEIAAPRSLLLALLRCMTVFFQGTWFWHVGSIMFTDHMAWDMNDMAAVMFLPVVFCLHILCIALGTFSAYLFMRWLYARLRITSPAGGAADDGDAELALGSLLETQLELAEFAGLDAPGSRGLDARSKQQHAHHAPAHAR